jgi:hypothetical protein
MYWWVWLLIALIIFIGFGIARRHRNRRAKIIINIPVTGFVNFQITPHDASPEDLILLALCYGSKIRWLLQTEPEQVRDIFHGLCNEVTDFWSAPGADLIDRMPTARQLREDDSSPHAVAGGEQYIVTLYRTDYHNLSNKAWVITAVPRPSLAANIPWSFLLVLNAVFVLLKPSEQETLRQAIANWYKYAFEESHPNRSISSLNSLFKASLDIIVSAKTKVVIEQDGDRI